MCLSKVDFKLEYQKGYWIGKGYKNLSLKIDRNNKVLFNHKWQEATGSFSFSNKIPLHRKTEYGNDSISYCPGFHIFLDKIPALNYGYGYLVEVLYNDILAYGTNDTYGSYNNIYGSYPCIISKYMKINKVLAHFNNHKYYEVIDNFETKNLYKVD